jgi:hypothetical protein
MYQVYQLGWNASVTLNLLSLGPERKVKCYNRYFINGHVFHSEEYDQGSLTYDNGSVLKDQLIMNLKLTTMGS